MSRPMVRYAEQLPSRADLVVVGGGIVGCATAFFASRAGLDVVVIERHPALATLTTPVSTGAFRLQFDNTDEIALVREGIDLFDHFAERTGLDGWELGLRHGGYLFCSLTDGTLDRSRRLVERQRTWGLADVELLSGDEARYRWPWLSPAVLGARYRAGDGWLDPKRLAIGYAAASSAAFCTGMEVTGFQRTDDGSRIIGLETSSGAISTEAVVVAAGPFTAQVAALAGLGLEIATTPRQKMVIPDLPAIPADAPMTIEEETAAHWRPALRGCLALWTDAETPSAQPSDAPAVDPGWAFGLLDPDSGHALARVAPFWADVWREGSVSWYLQAGQYEMTPDRRPYLGPGGPQGLHLNGGYSGHGIMASAAGSRLVVDLLTGRADPGANPFRIDRAMIAREHDIL